MTAAHLYMSASLFSEQSCLKYIDFFPLTCLLTSSCSDHGPVNVLIKILVHMIQ